MNEGFFVNLGLFPAVPVKNTGVRITVSRHNELEDIKGLVEAMEYHFPKALEETDNSLGRIGKAFNIEINSRNEKAKSTEELSLTYTETIQEIEESSWNQLMGHHTILNWKGLEFLENSFRNHESKEHRWSFHYFIITDQQGNPILATFMTCALWKNDMLSPSSVSKTIEEKRKSNPYELTSRVLSMGSLFTEGVHWYLDEDHPLATQAIKKLLLEIEILSARLDSKMTVLRDFKKEPWLSDLFHQEGFIPIEMPDSCIIDDLSWNNEKEFEERLSSRSRKHFRKEVLPFEDKFEISIHTAPTPEQIQHYYQLYKNVKANNLGLNTFTYPESLFKNMVSHTSWEFIELKLKDLNKVVGIMFCYKNDRGIYVPSLVGMDYDYAREFQVYRQLLYQTIKRARDLNMKRIDLGFSASFEKRKFGAKIIGKHAFIQSDDNYLLEQLDMMRNE